MHFTLFYSYVENKGDYSTGDPKAPRWPSESLTPHLALSVMKNDKREDKQMDQRQKTNKVVYKTTF